MAEIDIFSLQPSTISRDLSGKSFLIYGTRKSGKTSNAVKFPKPLVMGFEKVGICFLVYMDSLSTNGQKH